MGILNNKLNEYYSLPDTYMYYYAICFAAISVLLRFKNMLHLLILKHVE